jgi:hypothetical protein
VVQPESEERVFPDDAKKVPERNVFASRQSGMGSVLLDNFHEPVEREED